MQNLTTLYNRLVKRSMDWSLGVKTKTKLAGQSLRLIPLIFGHLTRGYVKVTWGFAKNANKMYLKMGSRGLAIYLKTCYLLLQHFAGGQRDASPKQLGCNVSRTRRGIPRIINVNHRRLIASGDIRIIRFWLSLFGLYRVLPYKGSLKLKTIIEPGLDESSYLNDWQGWVPRFLDLLKVHAKHVSEFDPERNLRVTKIPPILKASPNSQGLSSIASLPLDLLVWWQDNAMSRGLVRWLKLTDSLSFGHDIAVAFVSLDRQVERWLMTKKVMVKLTPIAFLRGFSNQEAARRVYVNKTYGKPLFFGKLGFKQEPGKIRVFAMVNLITQALMQPLHDWIFSVLRCVPTDGTFNQVAPVELLIKRFIGKEYVASFDLSAATDRLPVVIQEALLKPLLGDELATLWRAFLVSKPYQLPRIAKSYNLGFSSVKYAVGQPMGALSSWAMLALTHHAIVQFAASKAYPKAKQWFGGYALLGDDIVIADKLVAREYLALMGTLGVEIGLAKSLISSTGSLEFAKRTWVKGQACSPISLMEMSVAASSITALEELIRELLPYGVISMAAVARFCGFQYKNLARLPVAFSLNNRLSRLLGYLHRPGGIWPMSIETWLASRGPGVLKGLDWEVQRAVVLTLAEDVLDLIDRVLERAKGEINSTFQLELLSATRKVRGSVEKIGKGNRKQGWKTIPVYGPILKGAIGDCSAIVQRIFKEWVLYPYTSVISRKASALTVRLREWRKSRSIAGFNGLESIWRWITDLESGLAALPLRIDLFAREDDVRVHPSSLIRLWIKLRRKVARKLASGNS